MRKMMQRQITSTKVTLSEIAVVDGQVQVNQLPDEIIIGNVSMSVAEKRLTAKLGKAIKVVAVEPNTHIYEMSVEEFIQLAKIVDPTEQPEPETVV